MLWKAEWLLIENIRCAAWIGTVVSCVLISVQTNLLILYTVCACKSLAGLNLSEDSYGNIIIYEYKYIICSFLQTAKNTPTARAMAEPCYGFLVVVLAVLLLKLLYIITSMLYVCPVLLCITCLARNWLEDHHVVLTKTHLICDHFDNFFKGTVVYLEHIECLQGTPVTMYMGISRIITFGFDI